MDEHTRTLHVTIEVGDAPAQSKQRAEKRDQVSMHEATDRCIRPKLPIDTLSRLLSERNIDLLRMIKAAQPRSVAELARLSGRPKASLTLTLRRLEKFGIVAFETANGRRKIPTVACDRLMLEVAIKDV